MKQLFFILTAFVYTLLASGCGPHEHGGEHNHDLKVELNSGERWEANPETTEGINNMQSLMESFSATEDPAAYAKLRENLETEFQFIFENCTMKGEAHDQLHNYLLPMKDMFKGLESTDTEERKEQVRMLKDHLSKYTAYFSS